MPPPRNKIYCHGISQEKQRFSTIFPQIWKSRMWFSAIVGELASLCEEICHCKAARDSLLEIDTSLAIATSALRTNLLLQDSPFRKPPIRFSRQISPGHPDPLHYTHFILIVFSPSLNLGRARGGNVPNSKTSQGWPSGTHVLMTLRKLLLRGGIFVGSTKTRKKHHLRQIF